MPISADRFEAIEDDDSPTPGTNAHEILSFLEEHADQAFTQTEIAEATGIKQGSVGPTLVRLRDTGRVDHRGHYWRVSDHLQHLDAALAQSSATAMRDEDEPFDVEEWAPYAVDPRTDRD